MKAAGWILSPFLKATGVLDKIGGLFKSPKPPTPPGPVTRDDARDAAARNAELLKRRGGAADMLTGNGGAEAGAGSKTMLGS